MPPPVLAGPVVAPKRPHPEDDDSGSRSSKVPSMVAEAPIDRLSDSEMNSLDDAGGSLMSGYESCGSTISVGSQFEVAQEVVHIPREKIRKVLDELHYKKSSDKIWNILVRELKKPELILPQLELLQKESKKNRRYSDAARCERLSRKIEEIIQEHCLADPPRP